MICMEFHSVYIRISSYPHAALFLVPWLDKHPAVWDLSWLHGIASCIVSQSTHRPIGGWELYSFSHCTCTVYGVVSRPVLSPISICTLQSLCNCSSGSAVSHVSLYQNSHQAVQLVQKLRRLIATLLFAVQT